MTPSSKTCAFAVAVLAAASFAMTAPAAAHEHPQTRTIALAATGTVKTTPDKVDISTGVTSEAPTARAALDQNTEAMAAVVAALKADGIEAKDIQTVNFNVMPVYEHRPEPQIKPVPPRIVAYRVVNQVRISLADTGKLGAVLDKVVTLGANTIDSIEFGVSDPEPLKNEARKLAVHNALANAKLYAEAAGVELGPIQSISEDEGGHIPRYAAQAARMEMAKDVPIEAGTATIEMRVRIVWELK